MDGFIREKKSEISEYIKRIRGTSLKVRSSRLMNGFELDVRNTRSFRGPQLPPGCFYGIYSLLKKNGVHSYC